MVTYTEFLMVTTLAGMCVAAIMYPLKTMKSLDCAWEKIWARRGVWKICNN